LLLPPGKTHQNPPEIFSGLATPPPSPVTRHPSPVTRRPKSISHKKPETDSTFVLSNHVTFSPLNSFNSVNPFNQLPAFPLDFLRRNSDLKFALSKGSTFERLSKINSDPSPSPPRSGGRGLG